MTKEKTISIFDQTWILHPEKAVFWKDTDTLILTDLHLGKSGHFRKSGIAAPGKINSKNLERLTKLLTQFMPSRLYILGDLFHSSANRDWFEFEEWLNTHTGPEITLLTGNHDLLHASFYQTAGIQTAGELKEGPFHFIHDSGHLKNGRDDSVPVSGHIHPGIILKGKARQSLRFPCFLISEKKILLPAFGEFTGLHRVKPDETDRVYAVVDHSVIEMNR